MWVIILLWLLCYLIYLYGFKPLKYWKERGVPFVKPWPFVGNMGSFVFRKRSHAFIQDDAYKSHPNSRYVGFYNFAQPSLIIRDPNLLKEITVKEFDIFPDHRQFVPEDIDPIWSKNLFAMRGGQKWQDMRATLSPSFTSSKMRMMFELMKECSTQFSNHFLKDDPDLITVEMKDALTRFTNDVVATTAFGVTCDSLGERENEFYLMGKEVSDVSGIKALRFLIYFFLPIITKLFRIPIFNKNASKFFRSVISNSIRIREEKGIVRPDMIHLLMEARKGLNNGDGSNVVIDSGFAVVQESERRKVLKHQKSEITFDDMTAQALIFFLAGFDSVSTTMCYAVYELAANPDIQETLRKEVDETLAKSKDGFTYETLVGMKYLDMVISETLRKWPSFVITDRVSVRPHTIEPNEPGEKPLHLEAGTAFFIPIFAIQRDPQYYPNPDRFDPERFSDENKQNIKPFTYLPFGSGPRNCIGARFALLESKLIVAEIISKFEIVPVEKTKIPVQPGVNNFNPVPDEGFWLGLKRRNLAEGIH